MFGLFKKDPIKQLTEDYKNTLDEAMQAERNGDIRTYSALSEKAESIGQKLETLMKNDGKTQ